MNMAGEVDQLKYARSKGIYAMGETCPQYLFFTEENLQQADGAKWICSPRCVPKMTTPGCRQGLEDGTIKFWQQTTVHSSLTVRIPLSTKEK